MAGTLYLIPVPIAEAAIQTCAPEVISVTRKLQYYVVENTRTARRILRSWHPHLVLESIEFSEIDKHDGPDIPQLKRWLREGKEVGMMSEAGCPAIADPGSELVAVAHELGAIIKPLSGPSSIILSLMASGLGGQNFAFWGYLPVKEPARSSKIKALELQSRKEAQTQIFIETPYRNESMMADLLRNCAGSTRLCIAQNIGAPDEHIRMQSITDWKKQGFIAEKVPTVFLIQA